MRLRAKAVCMRFNLILFVLVLVLVLEKRKFVKKLLDTVSRTRTSTTTRTIRQEVEHLKPIFLVPRIWSLKNW